jgi:hypothetical protein
MAQKRILQQFSVREQSKSSTSAAYQQCHVSAIEIEKCALALFLYRTF